MKRVVDDADLLRATFASDPPLVAELLGEGQKIVLVGRPAAGKSVLGLQLASSVAGRHSFLGMDVPAARRVLYVSGEGNLREVQARRREMERVLPVQRDMLWHWAMPDFAFNTSRGYDGMLAVAGAVKPALTVVDPMYATLRGATKEEAPVNDYLRNLNRYAEETKSAVWLVHHTHRPVRNQKGEVMVEENPYSGTWEIEGWAQRMFLLKVQGGDKSRLLICTKDRDGPLEDREWQMTLVEPSPLYFMLKEAGVSATDAVVRYWLAVGEATVADLERLTRKSHGAVTQAVAALAGRDEVEVIVGRPTRYRLRRGY